MLKGKCSRKISYQKLVTAKNRSIVSFSVSKVLGQVGETFCCTHINSITDKVAEVFGQPESKVAPNGDQVLVLDGPLREL